ncbi:excinuclease ABC subunit UvrC [Geovibrio thiophilus]|uniref:UvrABC system protein C n=1 Tax=Geovibrio thiophilus TaxID=139438 RepID=A0A410JXG3_9BACT|nr:excinuclease ABC subunit UvrC [Geovibrio thiophilus]QAR32867.1 excinuclease ABC subunit UvrC [Geovibrio thiophilus]
MDKYPLHEIPEYPGVYLFIGKKGEILYVGKAKNLRSRVSSYFADTDKPVKVLRMVEAAVSLRFVVTDNEAEALLLEANFIKTEQPRYNIRLKDSKSYPYIKITGERYPKLAVTRNTSDEKDSYFGPFVNVSELRGILSEILRVFPLRSCNDRKFAEKKHCLKFQIKKCLGPCEGTISEEEYMRMVEQIRTFFKGDTDGVRERLKSDMALYSERMEYEKAAFIRDRLRSMEKLFYRQTVVFTDEHRAVDVFIPHTFENLPGITTQFIRNGKLIGNETVFFEDENTENILESYIMQFYGQVRQFPDVVVPFGLDDNSRLAEALSKMAGKKKTVITRGFRKLQETALENARIQTETYIRQLGRRKDVNERLKSLLKTDRDIRRIECIDISHLGGNHTVGVAVTGIDGHFAKGEYRKYKIKSAENDDFTSIYELFTRKMENIAEGSETAADLYIIDGGIGQLNSAVRAAEEAGSDSLFISISKGRSIKFMKHDGAESIESIHLYGRKNPVNLKKNDPLLMFVQRMRDEAHRFAITYSRSLALKNLTKSPMLGIEGLGEKRLRKLLETIPDIHARKGITAEEINAETGIPPDVCLRVAEYLRTV